MEQACAATGREYAMTGGDEIGRLSGGCMCGAVRYEAAGPFRPPIACHCEQCRRWSGHFLAATAVHDDRLSIPDASRLHWYRSSDAARRGFCGACGSALFWQELGSGQTAIMCGSMDAPTGLQLTRHIFTAEAGDYYRLDDDLPKHEGDGPPRPIPDG